MCRASFHRICLLGLSVAILPGCGEPGPEPVSGTVTFQGQPLDQGLVQFEPAGNGASSHSGGTIKDGKFDVPAVSGLMPGSYRVRISSADRNKQVPEKTKSGGEIPGMGGGRFVFAERIPAKYNSQSDEIVEVKRGGPNIFEFKID